MPFPPDFLFGTANADHQVEAHNPEREDVWDLWERVQGLTPRKKATDFWNRYPEDIANAAAAGCKLFRFSLAWARVEPREGVFDPEALAHYRRVAECVRDHGMQVMVTLHHFVWPVWLERDHGGMIGREFPDLFARYAAEAARALGDIVDWWITFNEPSQLTFGYIRPWWQNRYYMPPGLPHGTAVDAEAEAVGTLVPNLFLAHARARREIRAARPEAKVGVNPLVTGFPPWLTAVMDWGACHRGLSEALFKFTTRKPLVRERGDVDLVIGGITVEEPARHEFGDPYLGTGKAVLVLADHPEGDLSSLAGKDVAVVAVGNQPEGWRRDLPASAKKKVHADYDAARTSLATGKVAAVYGDAVLLMPEQLRDPGRFRFLVTGLSREYYVVAAAHGHRRLMERADLAIAAMHAEDGIERPDEVAREAPRPLSLHEVFHGGDSLPDHMSSSRDLRRIRRRGRLRVGLRTDTPGLSPQCTGEGIEMKLARRIAREVLGDESLLEIVPLRPADRLVALESPSSWLNWAWRFWGTTSLIANANWWYLGMSGRLPEELCPAEAVGAHDFVGLDYYWGLPTTRLHQFRLLEDAAHGRFLNAPVWPAGLLHALRRFHRWFPGKELLIVENGCVPEADGISRGEYLRQHLAMVEQALAEGLPVKAYNYWSITSNREWGHPFDPNTDFGLYFVDLDRDPDLVREETEGLRVFREFIAKRGR